MRNVLSRVDVVHASHGRAGGQPLRVDEDAVERVRVRAKELADAGSDTQKVGADVIVIGTRRHSAIAGLLVGSVTQRLLHVAPCPLLSIPPGG